MNTILLFNSGGAIARYAGLVCVLSLMACGSSDSRMPSGSPGSLTGRSGASAGHKDRASAGGASERASASGNSEESDDGPNDKLVCTVDADCDADEVCSEGRCTGLVCEDDDQEGDDDDQEGDDDDEEGDNEDDEEVDDKITCTVNADCDCDEICVRGLCTDSDDDDDDTDDDEQEADDKITCSTNLDCDSDEVCNAGRCTDRGAAK